jgi:hypothetical protein
MKKQTKIALFTLIAATTLAVPVWLHAQDASPTAPSGADTTPAPSHHKHTGAPFRGTVDGVDTNAMTLTVGSRTFQVTSSTKIQNYGQPGILADATNGEAVTGYYRPDADNTNTLDAVTIHLGKSASKKHKASSDAGSSPSTTSTNSAAGN